jgi:hypothetical protein
VADITDIDTDRSKRGGLTSEAIFRVWKAAINDDEKLLDELIATVHKQMMSLDQARAERVMSLVIRRHCNAISNVQLIILSRSSSSWPNYNLILTKIQRM